MREARSGDPDVGPPLPLLGGRTGVGDSRIHLGVVVFVRLRSAGGDRRRYASSSPGSARHALVPRPG
ncbi:hypothetical protein GCM10010195_66170 [Kitasatospora griseola]|nr:hypothetical protein GCM10010195_66170 [Kitasatospora griseola]